MITQSDGLHADDETATEYEVQDLIGALIKVVRPKLFVETGAYKGATTELIGRCMRGVGKVISCETNPDYLAEARRRCSGLPVTIYGRKSSDVLEVQYADMLFLDSDYKYRTEEFLRTKRGAVVLIHDTAISYDPDVKPLAQFVRSMGGIVLPTYRGLGVIIRP